MTTTNYEIQTHFQGTGYVQVPNVVAQSPDLSADALGVLVFLASLPNGFTLRVVTIQERFRIGKDKWQRIARELRACGAMASDRIRGHGGRVIGERIIVRWPFLEPAQPDETAPADHREPGFPAAGKSASKSRETRLKEPGNPAPYKDKEKPRARHVATDRKTGRSAAQRKGAATRPDPAGEKGKAGTAAPLPSLAPDEAKQRAEKLTSLQRGFLRRGEGFLIAGQWLAPEAPAFAQLCEAMRATE